jgi:hypothetical protein
MEMLVAAGWLLFLVFLGKISDGAKETFVALMWCALPLSGLLLLGRLFFR